MRVSKKKFNKYLSECDKIFFNEFGFVKVKFCRRNTNRFFNKKTMERVSVDNIRQHLTDRFGIVNIVWISQRIKYYEKMKARS